MYAQPDLTAMYTGIATGYLAWAGLYLWVRATHPRRAQNTIS